MTSFSLKEHTLSKDYGLLESQLSAHDPSGRALAELNVAWNSGNPSSGDKDFIEFLAGWLNNSHGDDSIALGGVMAALKNHLDLRASTGATDYPQILGLIVSNKWGTSSNEWKVLMNLKSQPNGAALTEWLYAQWALQYNYSLSYLQSALNDPSSWVPLAQATPLGPDPSTPLPPPYGPPSSGSGGGGGGGGGGTGYEKAIIFAGVLLGLAAGGFFLTRYV